MARVAKQQIGRSRTFNAIVSAVRTTIRSFTRAAHQLWLEVMGTLFLVMALFGASKLVPDYLQYHAGRSTASHVAVIAGFTATFAWFGVTSFWRARRKSQGP